MSVHLGRILTDKEEVDHKDDNKCNDDLSNLQVLTLEEHNKKTQSKRKRSITHGTLYGYVYFRCRCGLCSAASSSYRRKRIVAPIQGRWTHGTTSGYSSGCRCRLCMDAHNAYNREYRKRI